MARRPPLPTPSALRRRREHRTQRILANRAVADALISAAGLVGRPVKDRMGSEVGRVVDVVVRWRLILRSRSRNGPTGTGCSRPLRPSRANGAQAGRPTFARSWIA